MPRGPLDEPRRPPKGHRAIAFAVVEQAVHDVAHGRPSQRAQAWEWMETRAFEYWCDWCDLNPDYLRRSVAPLLANELKKRAQVGGNKGTGRVFSAEDLADAIAQHDAGQAWKVVAERYGTNEMTLRMALKAAGYDTGRRNRLVTRRGAAAR